MAKPRLTPHQAEVFSRVQQVAKRRPVHVKYIGSLGALTKLWLKGYVVLEERSGPRGGSHWFVSLPEEQA